MNKNKNQTKTEEDANNNEIEGIDKDNKKKITKLSRKAELKKNKKQ